MKNVFYCGYGNIPAKKKCDTFIYGSENYNNFIEKVLANIMSKYIIIVKIILQ